MTLFNADDYGITIPQAEHILDCRKNGRLTGVSAMPNSPHLEAAMALLEDDPDLLVAVHLNVTEGLCLSDPADVPLLAGPDGRFRESFSRLLIQSVTHPRALRAQLIREFTLQIRRALPLMGDRPLRLDGHQHIQMLPAVLAAIRDTARQNGWTVSYIRWAREPIGPYLRHRELRRYYSFINLIKNAVLNLLSIPGWHIMKDMGLAKNAIMGLMLSGDMEYEPVSALLPDMERAAARRGADLELVMHPGWGVGPGQGLDKPGGIFEQFYLSPGRKAEYDCLHKL